MMHFQLANARVDLATEFSPTPLGRYRRQGRYSGEAFREDVLRPALAKHRVIEVDLDGASGLSTGFLDEAFGGLVREGVLTAQEFHQRVIVVATRDPLLADEIREYVAKAASQVAAH